MLIPGPDVYLEIMMLGTIISAIAYGIVIVLSGNCFLLLQKKRSTYSNRMRLFLLIYVVVMFLLSTLAIVQSIWGITALIFQDTNLPLLVGASPATLPLAIWGADGFMVGVILSHKSKASMGLQLQIWRCIVLYQDVARGPRILVIFLLSLLSIVSLGRSSSPRTFVLQVSHGVQGCGVVMFLDLDLSSFFAVTVLISLSTIVNIILALLIILRLIRHQRYIRKVLGAEHGSPYSKVITMCVESSALIVIISGVYTALVFEQANGSSIPFLLLPHICVGDLFKFHISDARLRFHFSFVLLLQVISPLLIVYRVAKGRATTTTLRPAERETAQIRFNNPPSSESGQGGEV